MFQKSTNTAAPSVSSLRGANSWDLKSLELLATAKKSTRCGSKFKTTLSCSGGSVTGGNGVCGFDSRETQSNTQQITITSFLTKDGNNK